MYSSCMVIFILCLTVLNVDKLKDYRPFTFEVDRGDGERIKVMYQQSDDSFYQIQESLHECSMFVGKAIMKETKMYLITPIDPMFFMLRALRYGVSSGQRMYQTLTQILDNCLGHLSHTDSDVIQISEPTSSDSLKDILLSSDRVKKSLKKICSTKSIGVADKGEFLTYCFEEGKLFEVLIEKHRRIV